ncbi:hypothetical protein T4D_10750 [Trichinella pseudospiralis]|uniref:Uncharacterized protein n=1 Tax=Trichinella pseudospiralis TaxID=6337 RepID=A0A0V1G6B3_TRIPS|nr:hypothetical protein T4D_10750 [Trichinella pseudospiralis]
MSQSVQFLPKSSTTPHASEPQPLLLAAQREEQILLKNKYPKHLCCRRCRHLSIEQPCSSINSYKGYHRSITNFHFKYLSLIYFFIRLIECITRCNSFMHYVFTQILRYSHHKSGYFPFPDMSGLVNHSGPSGRPLAAASRRRPVSLRTCLFLIGCDVSIDGAAVVSERSSSAAGGGVCGRPAGRPSDRTASVGRLVGTLRSPASLQHQQHASPVVDVKESAGDWTKKEPLRPNEKVQ